MNLRSLLAGVALLSTLAAGGTASAQYYGRQNLHGYTRGQRGSNRNLSGETRRLDAIINTLQNDRSDYGGHKDRAIELLQQARAELQQALRYRR